VSEPSDAGPDVSAFVLTSLVVERRKGQREDTPYSIAFFRKFFFQLASGFAVGYGLNSGSDDVPGRSTVSGACLVNLGRLP